MHRIWPTCYLKVGVQTLAGKILSVSLTGGGVQNPQFEPLIWGAYATVKTEDKLIVTDKCYFAELLWNWCAEREIPPTLSQSMYPS